MKIIKSHFLKYFVFFLVFLIILFSVYIVKQSKEVIPEKGNVKQSLVVKTSDHIFGSRDAKIKIIEYGEGECIYCKRLHPILIKTVEENKDNVAVIYRHFPLAVHPKSYSEATAFECVAEYGGNDFFWKYLGTFYQVTPSNNNTDLAILPQIAKNIGVPEKTFNECMVGDRHKKHIQDDIESGFSLNVDSTPHLFIISSNNGLSYIFTKSPSYNMLKTIIQNILNSGN